MIALGEIGHLLFQVRLVQQLPEYFDQYQRVFVGLKEKLEKQPGAFVHRRTERAGPFGIQRLNTPNALGRENECCSITLSHAHVEEIVLRTFLVESDDFRVVLQFKNASAKEELQAQSVIPIELVRVEEMSETVQGTIVTIVPSDANVETLDT